MVSAVGTPNNTSNQYPPTPVPTQYKSYNTSRVSTDRQLFSNALKDMPSQDRPAHKGEVTLRQQLGNIYGSQLPSLLDKQRAYTAQHGYRPGVPVYSNANLDRKLDLYTVNGGIEPPNAVSLLVGDLDPTQRGLLVADDRILSPAPPALLSQSTSDDSMALDTFRRYGLAHESAHGAQISQPTGLTLDEAELPLHMAELKQRYFDATGKTVPADASAEDINAFTQFYREQKPAPVDRYEKALKSLDTPNGEDMLRRVVDRRNGADMGIKIASNIKIAEGWAAQAGRDLPNYYHAGTLPQAEGQAYLKQHNMPHSWEDANRFSTGMNERLGNSATWANGTPDFKSMVPAREMQSYAGQYAPWYTRALGGAAGMAKDLNDTVANGMQFMAGPINPFPAGRAMYDAMSMVPRGISREIGDAGNAMTGDIQKEFSDNVNLQAPEFGPAYAAASKGYVNNMIDKNFDGSWLGSFGKGAGAFLKLLFNLITKVPGYQHLARHLVPYLMPRAGGGQAALPQQAQAAAPQMAPPQGVYQAPPSAPTMS